MTPQEYFQSHSLDEEFVKKTFGIAWDEDKIIIPIYGADRKRLYCKYRHLTGDTKFTFDKGGHPALFCIHKVLKLDKVVLCEGEPDCMRLWQEGIPAVTATSGVKTFNSHLASELKGKLVYICLDNDEAGQNEVGKYAEVLKESGATPMVVNFPSVFKDISVYFTEGGTKEIFQKFLDEAKTFEQWEIENRPEEWKIETGEELMNRDVPPEEWYIDRVLSADGFTIIGGAESTGKSFYTLTMAYSVVTGKPWLGKFPIKKNTSVLFIDKENSARRKKARIAGLGMRSVEALRKLYWISYPQYFQLADPKEEDGLSKFAKMVSLEVKRLDIGMVVIDSLTDIMVGNENSREDTQALFDALRILFPTQGILLLHHENKPSQGVSRTSSQRMRGSTNITAQIVSGFRVFPIPKTQNEFVLEQFKAGDSEKLKPFKVELEVKPNPFNSEKTIVADVKWKGDYYDEEGKAELAEENITDYLTENVVGSRQDIIDYCIANGISQRTCCTALTTLSDKGILEKQKDGHKTNYLLR